MSATAGGATMRDEQVTAGAGRDHDLDHAPDFGHTHHVDESDVRLALERLDLGDRALTVHRATAFLTALGVTVTHDRPAPCERGGPDDGPHPPTPTDPTRPPTPVTDPTAPTTPATVPTATTGPATTHPVAVESGPTAGTAGDDDHPAGDVANLLEVLAHLHDAGSTTLDDVRSRPRTPHARPTAPATA